MSEDRDPRTDPRRGDVLEPWEGTYTVASVSPSLVTCKARDEDGEHDVSFFRSTWRHCFTNARVVARGDDEEG